MRNYSRFIPGEEIDDVSQWRFGDVDGSAVLLAQQTEDQQAAQVQGEQAEQLRQQGYAEGFVQGRAQALLEAQHQINEFLAQQGQQTASELAALVASTRAQLDAAQQSAAQEVLDLAVDIAAQVLRHEVTCNPRVLLPVVQEALEMLVSDNRRIKIHLNPQDLTLLQPALTTQFPDLAPDLQAEPTMARGGCRLESGSTAVDATMPTRWRRTLSQLGRDLPWDEESTDES
ncbi:MAG: FliH/SctL family protein [Hylemonella sp.]|nr:FliH/SctL family protein [Hylemonella sp.]